MSSFLLSVSLWAAAPPAPPPATGPRTTMMAESPFTTFTAGAVAYALVAAFLVAVLLIGGMLVLNLGMMSKREEDRTGKRTPSDVGILKGNVWPEEEPEHRILPAEDEEAQVDKEPSRAA